MNAKYSILQHRNQGRRGFSVVELMVVVAIIILLVSVLLAALSGVRTTAKVTQTEARMTELARAIDEYQLEFNRYPGAVPEDTLAADPLISGTENVLLALMGGYITPDHPDWDTVSKQIWKEYEFTDGTTIKVNPSEMGVGPIIDGAPRSPFFSPKESVLQAVGGQTTNDVQTRHWIPDLLDGWDQPIIYVGSMRARGTLVKDPAVPNGRPQYSRMSMFPYLESVLLGDAGANQAELSILSDAVATTVEADKNFAQILRNPGFGEPDEPLRGQARGRYLIMSAGEDNIFFSKTDGPGSIGAEVSRINDDPGFVKQYDDIVRAGGG